MRNTNRRILMSHKAKLNNIDAYKQTPLVIAVWRNRTEVVRELLAHGLGGAVDGRLVAPQARAADP